MTCCYLAISQNYLSNIHLCCIPWGLTDVLQVFSPTILIFTYRDSLIPSKSDGRVEGKKHVNNLVKSYIHRKYSLKMTPRNHLFRIPAARQPCLNLFYLCTPKLLKLWVNIFHVGFPNLSSFKQQLHLAYKIHNSVRFSSTGIVTSRLLEIKKE